jgi:hypothetical protein
MAAAVGPFLDQLRASGAPMVVKFVADGGCLVDGDEEKTRQLWPDLYHVSEAAAA